MGRRVRLLDARIAADPHWPALAAQLERAAATGTDVAAVLAQVTTDNAADDHPARSLAYRVADVVPDLRSPPACGLRDRTRRPPDEPHRRPRERRSGHLPPARGAETREFPMQRPIPRRGNFSAKKWH